MRVRMRVRDWSEIACARVRVRVFVSIFRVIKEEHKKKKDSAPAKTIISIVSEWFQV